jgi:hypothetical protein
MALTDEDSAVVLAEVRTRLGDLAERVATLRTAVEPEHLDDGARERMEAMFAELTDAQAVEHLLAIHKFVEFHATGKASLLAEAEAHAIALTLLRVAPEAFADGLALYMEHSEDREEEGDDDA